MTMASKDRPPVPPTEVTPKARRRTFSAAFKAKVLAEVDACTEPGAISAVLRRHGLYSSHLVEWRGARERGQLAALAPQPRGPKVPPPDPRDERIRALEREVAQLTTRAERAETLVALQKKVAAVLETLDSPTPRERS